MGSLSLLQENFLTRINPGSPTLQTASLPAELTGKQSLSSVHSVNCVQLFATPWTASCQASLSITSSQSLLKLMSIELVVPSNHLILCCPLLPPAIFPSIRVFSNELAPCIRWPELQLQHQSFNESGLPVNIQDRFPLEWTGWIPLQSEGLSGVFSNTTVLKHQFFGAQPSLWSHSHIRT